MPANFVTFQNAEGRRNSGRSDVKTNIAEAGTMSLEFTALGRLLGKRDTWHGLSLLVKKSAEACMPCRLHHVCMNSHLPDISVRACGRYGAVTTVLYQAGNV